MRAIRDERAKRIQIQTGRREEVDTVPVPLSRERELEGKES